MLLIDKDDLIEHIQKRHREYYFYYNMSEYYEGLCDAYYAVLNFILKQKTIEEHKHSYWEPFENINRESTFRCANCKNEVPYDYIGGYELTEYCPHCGAVMD